MKCLDELQVFKEKNQIMPWGHRVIAGASLAHHMQQAMVNLAKCHGGIKGQKGRTTPQGQEVDTSFNGRGPSAHNEEETLPQEETNTVAEDSGPNVAE